MSINDGLARPRGNEIDAIEHFGAAQAKKVVIASADGSGNGLDIDTNGSAIVAVHANLQQERFDYGTRDDGQPVHAGYAARGVSTSATSWVLHKFTYNDDGFVILKQTAIDSWDNFGGATYA